MQGKTIVITGATSGIGEVAALRLAGTGARIVFIARDAARGEATLARLKSAAPDAAHAVHYADLSLISEMKRVASEIAAAEPTIDVLLNNAGAMFTSRQETADGLEKTFALNHMSYFVVTNLLLAPLKAAGKARVVSTSSDAHKAGRVNFSDLQARGRYSGFGVYGNTKMMNVLFTRELARRLDGTSVTANCLHPGFVATRFGDNNSGLLKSVFGLAKNFALTPEKGARTMIYLASSPELDAVTGKYFNKCREETPAAAARDDATAKRLWEVSAELAGLTP